MSDSKKQRKIRVKAISLLYLVFIALAFIYIPSDFIDAVWQTEKSLVQSTKEIEKMRRLKFKIYEAASSRLPKARILDSIKYRKITSLTQETYDRLDSMKERLLYFSGGLDQAGYPARGKDYDLSNQLLFDDSMAYEVRRMLYQYSEDMRNVADDERSSFLIDSVLSLPDTMVGSKNKAKVWEKFYFEKMPLSVTMMVFSRFQNQIRMLEYLLLDKHNRNYMQSLIMAVEQNDLDSLIQKSDNIFHAISSKSSYALGEKITYFTRRPLKKGKDTSELDAKVEFMNEIDQMDISKQGVVTYRPKRAGKYKVIIRYDSTIVMDTLDVVNPEPVIEKFGYSVIYVGIYNPLKVNMPPGVDGQVFITTTKGKVYKKEGVFYLYVDRPGLVEVKVFVSHPDDEVRRLANKKFTAKNLPKPEPLLAERSGGKVSSKILKLQKSISVLSDVVSDPKAYFIKEFSLTRISGDSKNVEKIEQNPGAVFNPETNSLIGKARMGDVYIFDGIKVQSADGRLLELASMVFTII